jgi:hypothetical protein
VRLLTAAFDPGAPPGASSPRRPLIRLVGAAGVALALGVVAEAVGLLPALGRAIQIAALHGAFIAAGEILANPARARGWRVGLPVAGALAGAAWLSSAAAGGWCAYAVPPLVLAWRARRPGGRGTPGWAAPARLREIALGLLVGVLLGAHLLVTAARTFGYAVGAISAGAYLADLAYDAGANALSATWFFHGGLFSWLWRRIDFWPAAAAATAAGLARYLLDPALPRATEVAVGAVFYLAVLGMACCAIRARTGSAGAVYAATLGFFAAYRGLSGW